MKSAIVFIAFILVGLVAGGILFGYYHFNAPQKTKGGVSPVSYFSLSASPKNSLIGSITALSGTVNWQSRTATAPAVLKTVRTIQQGEELITGHTGTVSVSFPAVCTITEAADTDVSFIQTLPENIVIDQTNGTVQYSVYGKYPLGLRSLDLLVEMKRGAMSVSVDDSTSEVFIRIINGTATAAYEDATNYSNVISLRSGNQLVFDDNSLEATIE
jgi:hypothetical protein